MGITRGIFGRLLGGIKETTYNSDPATLNAVVLPFNTCSLRATQNTATATTIRGRRDPAKPFRGNINVAGDVVVPMDVITFGHWLTMLMADPTVLSLGAGWYKHTWKVKNQLDSFLLEGQYLDNGLYAKYNGCKAKSLAFTVGGDGELVATIGITGGKETVGAASIDATPIKYTFNRFDNFQASLLKGGVALSTAREFQLTFDNNLDESIYLIGGLGFRGALPEGIGKVTGRLKTMFESWTEYEEAVNGTETSLVLTFTNGTYVLRFTLNELMFSRNAPAIEGPAGVFLDSPFEAYWDDDAGQSAITVELTTTVSSYAAADIPESTTTTTTTTSTTTSSTTTTTTA